MADDPSIPTVTVREWTDVVRRARLGRTLKSVALAASTYADFQTGRRVRPGLARLAYDAELHYSTVKAAMSELRRIGLLLLVQKATSRGGTDDYRLIIGPDLLDHVDVPTPAAAGVEIERIRAVRRKPARPVRTAVQTGDARPPAPAVDDGARPGPPAVQTTEPAECTAGRTDHAEGCTAGRTVPARPAAPAPNSQRPTTTPNSHPPIAVDGDPQTARDPAVDEPDSTGEGEQPTGPTEPPLPDRCEHGFPARRRPDGSSSCALCRRAAGYQPPPPPNAVPRTTRPTLTLVKPA